MSWIHSGRTSNILTGVIIGIVGITTLRWGNITGIILGVTLLVMAALIISFTVKKPALTEDTEAERPGNQISITMIMNGVLTGTAALMAYTLLARAANAI